MSRAFTKESDVLLEPIVESHTPGVPVRVTATGRNALQKQLAETQSDTERLRLERLVGDLVVVEAPADRSSVAFGATVDVHGDEFGDGRFTVVGADEADVAAGRVSETSPLGAALLGGHVGEVVTWHRPAGDAALTIIAIAYDDRPQADEARAQ